MWRILQFEHNKLTIKYNTCASISIICRLHAVQQKQEGAAVEGPPAMRPSLQTDRQTEGTAVAMVTRSFGTRRREVLMTPEKIWSWSVNRRWSYGDFLQTAQLAAVTLNFDPLTLKLVHGVLVFQGPFLPSSVFLGHFVFALRGGTRRTNGRTDGRNGRCHGNEVIRCKAAKDLYATCHISSWSDNRRRSYGDFSPTTQLAAVTLTCDPLTLKLVHGTSWNWSQGPFLPSLVFVGLFVFPLGGGTGQTDRRTGSTHDGASF